MMANLEDLLNERVSEGVAVDPHNFIYSWSLDYEKNVEELDDEKCTDWHKLFRKEDFEQRAVDCS